MNAKNTFLIILSFALLLTACTSHVEYDPPPSVPAVAEAVNINTATVDELERLPRIGRKTAEAIVEYRETNGPFRRAENLMLIRGISEARFAELRPYIKTE